MGVEFGDRTHRVRFDDVGVFVDDRLIGWAEVGALGIVENAARKNIGKAIHGGPSPGLPIGCLGVCVVGDVDVVLAFGLALDCLGTRPTPAETERATALVQRELGELWVRVPSFAPANVKVGDWWRSQVYGPGSHAHTDDERVRELRADLAKMRAALDD